MLQQFLNHIERHQLCKATDKILLAVSGGIDSMSMLELFLKAGFRVGVAHVNYQLRGGESEADENLVADTCARYNLPFHVVRVDTLTYSRELKLSVQLTARKIRYDFFDSLLSEGYDRVATAHHLDDSLETVLLNLARGTGIDGVSGIPVVHGDIIRPLLFASRKEIKYFANENKLQWREDQSNAEDHYLRNIVRHHVTPRLLELNPSLHSTFSNSLERLRAAQEIVQRSTDALKQSESDLTIIDAAVLDTYSEPGAVLWEAVKDYGFNYDQCKQVVSGDHAGRQFHSGDFTLTVNRGKYIIKKVSLGLDESWIEQAQMVARRGEEVLEIFVEEDMKFGVERNEAFVDFDRVRFPLLWRTWKIGDAFVPLGMQGSKKISDLLVDLKIPRSSKENVSVLESDGKIIWVVGLRVDDRFKVTPETKRVLRICRRLVSAK